MRSNTNVVDEQFPLHMQINMDTNMNYLVVHMYVKIKLPNCLLLLIETIEI